MPLDGTVVVVDPPPPDALVVVAPIYVSIIGSLILIETSLTRTRP